MVSLLYSNKLESKDLRCDFGGHSDLNVRPRGGVYKGEDWISRKL